MTPVIAFDVGETLIDETRIWMRHAGRLGVSPMTFFGVFGAFVAADRPHRDVFAHFGVDAATYLAGVDALDDPVDGLLAEDLYADAVPTLRALRAAGHRIAIAGNQPARAAAEIRLLGVDADVVATSSGWGVSKPETAFFERLAAECGVPPCDVTYVGDRLDNDVLPAQRAGMTGVLIRRGVWGHLHAARPEAAQAQRTIDSLHELTS